MAVSKTQNERPAIVALIDEVNGFASTIESHTQSIGALETGLANETLARTETDSDIQSQIGNGFSQQYTIANALNATNSNVSSIASDVSAISDSLENANDSIALLQEFVESLQSTIKTGATEEILVPANDDIEGEYEYDEPFSADTNSFVVIGIANDAVQSGITIDVVQASSDGFTYSVVNSEDSPVTIVIGFIAIAVSAEVA